MHSKLAEAKNSLVMGSESKEQRIILISPNVDVLPEFGRTLMSVVSNIHTVTLLDIYSKDLLELDFTKSQIKCFSLMLRESRSFLACWTHVHGNRRPLRGKCPVSGLHVDITHKML